MLRERKKETIDIHSVCIEQRKNNQAKGRNEILRQLYLVLLHQSAGFYFTKFLSSHIHELIEAFIMSVSITPHFFVLQ